MQENAPYSRAEIRAILSEYLDGDLDPTRMAEIDNLIEQNAEVKAELLKMQAIRGSLREAPDRDPPATELSFNKISDQVWKNIARQMEEDQASPLLEVDPEFISAYYDHEIPGSDPALQAFESQLFRNDQANRMLADIGTLSEAIRQYGYRLEESCTIDVTNRVMSALMVKEAEAQPLEPAFETISAYYDRELPARETIEANRLIENDPGARETIHRFNRISEAIQSISTQIQAQAPDLWPAVSQKLQESGNSNVIPLERPKARLFPIRGGLRVAIPVAAAAVLLLVMAPNFQPIQLESPGTIAAEHYLSMGAAERRGAELQATEAEHKMAVLDAAASMPAEENNTLAVIPVSARSAPQPMMKPQASMEMDFQGAMPAMAPAPSAPPAAAPQRVARFDSVSEPRSLSAKAKKKAPSSDEYLFQALSEQMPAEDIAAILGQ